MPLKTKGMLRKAAQTAKQRTKRAFRLLKSVVEDEIAGGLVFKRMKLAAEHAFAKKWEAERLGKKIITEAMISTPNLEYVKQLLEQGADIETRNKQGWTALMFAAANGHTKLCKFLLEHNANIEARTPKGSTPLMLAAMYDKDRTAEALMAHGARIDARNDNGDSAYDIAKKGRCPSITLLIYNFSMKMVGKMTHNYPEALFKPNFLMCVHNQVRV